MDSKKITCPKCKSENVIETPSGDRVVNEEKATDEIAIHQLRCKDCGEGFFEEKINF